MDTLHTLTDLVSAFGPSGAEREVSEVIEKIAAQFCDEVTRDTMGNLICRKKGSGPRVMFAAHMDSIGLVATHIDEKGFVHVGAVGGLPVRLLPSVPVRFQNGTNGTVCVSGRAERGKLKLSDLMIDIGAANREEAERRVQVGDVAVYDTRTVEAGERIISPYLDNRASCLVLLQAMAKITGSENDLYFVFTVQEEVGTRGAKTAAWTIAPDYGVAVDVTPADDEPDSKHLFNSVLGGGAAVKVMDQSVICHPWMVSRLMELASQNGIPAQRDVMRGGGTDAGPIHVTRSGVYTGGVSIPCRYSHSPGEMVDRRDITACADLVTAFAMSRLEKEC